MDSSLRPKLIRTRNWYAQFLALLLAAWSVVGVIETAHAKNATYRDTLSAGQEKWRYYQAQLSGNHVVRLTWTQSGADLDLGIDRLNGSQLTRVSGSTANLREEKITIWLQKGQEIYTKTFGKKGNGVDFTVQISSGTTAGGEGGSRTSFSGQLSGGQQRWHYFRAGSTNQFILNLQWSQGGANADLVLTDTSGRTLRTAASSSGNTRSETMQRDLVKGQEFYAKVFMRSGSNASYSLNVNASAPNPDGGGTGGGGTGGGGTGGGGTGGGTGGGGSTPAQYYLDDANRGTVRNDGFTANFGYPRVMMTETQALPAPHNRYTKFPIIAAQGANLTAIKNIQNYRATPYLRMFTPRATLEQLRFSNRGNCTQGLGIPFGSSTAKTEGCGVWAGHWLYDKGTQLAAAMNAGSNQIRVNNASGFTAGKYVAIYNGGIKDFRQAEHARITGVSGNTIFLAGNRYKSQSRNRSAGAWVRQHAHSDRGPTTFVFNMSTQCPRDANGRNISEYMANWLVNNLKRDVDGRSHNIDIKGLTFDVDTYFDVFNLNSDANNDLVADGGLSGSGVNWWGDGVEQFYQILRNRLPNYTIVGGHQQAYGHRTTNGVQIEGFPNGPLYKPMDTWTEMTSMMVTYLYRMARSPHGPAMVQNVMKHGTWLYPTNGRSNFGLAPVRLGLGLTAMDGGFFHHENTLAHPDTWYDEYSVYTSGSNYGQAVPKGDAWAARSNTGWLGKPTGPFVRLDPQNRFAPSKAKISANFESGKNGFYGQNVDIYTTNSQKKDGQAGLGVTRMKSYKKGRWEASVRGPSTYLQAGKDYTIVFSARASAERWTQVKLGNYGDSIAIGTTWRRYVIPFRSTQTGNRQLYFQLGLQNTEFFLDSVHVFEGDANVFRRDFERGTVIANATPSAVTVRLGSGYRRIRGTQDGNTNNGANLPETVTIPARDALFAIKRR